MPQCPGCRKSFSRGYYNHLRQTQKPACRAVLAKAFREILGPDSDTDDTEVANHLDFNFEGSDGKDDDEDDEEEDLMYGANDYYGEAPAPEQLKGAREVRWAAEEAFRKTPVVEAFPSAKAGAPIANIQALPRYDSYRTCLKDPDNPWAPFLSQLDWEVAHWAKVCGLSSTTFTKLLKINGVCERLGLSYHSSQQLNNIINSSLPEIPKFQRDSVVMGGEVFEMYSRNIIDCIKYLFSDPKFTPHLLLVPERHYEDATCTNKIMHEMNTCRWWWNTQKAVEANTPGATIVPVIISSDKTQLTDFGGRTAYPVYLTIGNLPKEIRRKPSHHSHVLLAYLPSTRLEHVSNKSARRRMLANLYHSCMGRIFQPLETAGIEGVQMFRGDGVAFRCHPILACVPTDYQEQVLITSVKTGLCPSCPIPRDEIGEDGKEYPLRDFCMILEALSKADVDPTEFKKACEGAGVKPIYHPFWERLPYTHIFRSITPDILHQLYQGVIRHLISWIKECCGSAEIDARCRRLPPNHNIRLFMKGISTLSRVTGKEHAQMASVLLGLIISIRLPGGRSPSRLLRAVHGLLNFLFLAQYPMHTTETLKLLRDALKRFHDNKDIFVDLSIRDNFNIPKLHFLDHYLMYIELFGTTDNCNTEYTERLHIDLAKDAWDATNGKDKFPQMTVWLEPSNDQTSFEKGCPVPSLIRDYGAINFQDALAQFVVGVRDPHLHGVQLQQAIANVRFHFNAVNVYHKIKFTSYDPYVVGGPRESIVDSIHSRPIRKDKRNRDVPARFDTAVINDGTGQETGVAGYRIGQVRVVFSLPENVIAELFPLGMVLPKHLAYVEWFSSIPRAPDPNHLLYKIKRSMKDGMRLASVIPVANIRRSAHLFPDFGPVAPRDWTSPTVLELCGTFFVNSTSDRYMYATFF
ncbi:hypothetical protein F5888DRAFT_1796512 [Russula emetica]|nr:hypothetical protein F5888DRAFT_1796512 [Russula emetica]